MTGQCKYCVDGMCVNDASPWCADFCLFEDMPGKCIFDDRCCASEGGAE